MAFKTLDEAARNYLGVPWRRMGRSRQGVDCVGLIVCAAQDCGIPIGDVPPYADEPQDTTLTETLMQYCNEISPKALCAGDIAVFQVGCYGGHLGIVSVHPEYHVLSVIHAFAPRKCVIEEPLESLSVPVWRVFRVRNELWPS